MELGETGSSFNPTHKASPEVGAEKTAWALGPAQQAPGLWKLAAEGWTPLEYPGQKLSKVESILEGSQGKMGFS